MEVTSSRVAQLFQDCATGDPSILCAAEQQLNQLSIQPRFLAAVLEIIENASYTETKFWDVDEKSGGIVSTDRTLVKSKLISLIVGTAVEKQIKPQLASAIQLIAAVDFPADWPDLIKSLVGTHFLGTENLSNKCVALEITDAILERYRHEEHSNEVLSELKFDILPYVQEPLLAVFQESVEKLIARGHHAAKTSEVQSYFGLVKHSCRLVLSLVSVDLPEFIEDHVIDFFSGFLLLLEYENHNLSGKEDEVEGPLEELKAEICRIFSLFVQRYTEESEQLVLPCVNAVLRVLLNPAPGTDMQSIYLDGLISAALGFLGNASKIQWANSPFLTPPTRLAEICEFIVIPNIQLREVDIELLEDNPQEFIRRDLEGSEADTRRGAVVDLVQALINNYENEISAVLPSYVATMIEAARSSTTMLERQKIMDGAVYLVIAVVVKAKSRSFGVARTSCSINVQEFLSVHLLKELQVPAKLTFENILARIATLKFISTFRNQIEKSLLLLLIPEVVKNLNYSHPVIHTHAAYCFENMLAARELGTASPGGFANATALHTQSKPKFTKDDLKEPCLQALSSILQLMKSQVGIRENEYLARSVLKILAVLDTGAGSALSTTVEVLRDILRMQCEAASNPLYTHLIFECIALTCKIGSSAGCHSMVENYLLETLSTILAQKEHEFTPYALQILGLVLDTATVASPIYLSLLDHILVLEQWTISTARVPGIVRVLSAFFRKWQVFQEPLRSAMETIMIRFQFCVCHKRLADAGFDIIIDAFHNLPLDLFTPYIKPLIMTLLERAGKSSKLSQQVAFAISIYECRSKTSDLVDVFKSINPSILENYLANSFIPSVKVMTATYEKKVCLLALVKFTSHQDVFSKPGLLHSSLETCAILMGVISKDDGSRKRNTVSVSTPLETFDFYDVTKPEEYQGSFNVLHAARVAVGAQEIQEVSVQTLLPSIKTLFSNPSLADKAHNDICWTQIISLLTVSG